MNTELTVTILCITTLLFLCWVGILQVRIRDMEKDIRTMKDYITTIRK